MTEKNVPQADVDVKAARAILARLCEQGLVRMSIPVRESDEDMILSRIIERAAAPAQPAAPAQEAVGEVMSHGYNGDVLWKGPKPPVGTLLYATPANAPGVGVKEDAGDVQS